MVYWTYGAEDHADMMRRKTQEQSTQTGSVNVTGVEQLDFSFQVRAKGEKRISAGDGIFRRRAYLSEI